MCYDTSKHSAHHHSQVDRVYLLNFVTFDDLEFLLELCTLSPVGYEL
jgi:hypothetical protein